MLNMGRVQHPDRLENVYPSVVTYYIGKKRDSNQFQISKHSNYKEINPLKLKEKKYSFHFFFHFFLLQVKEKK